MGNFHWIHLGIESVLNLTRLDYNKKLAEGNVTAKRDSNVMNLYSYCWKFSATEILKCKERTKNASLTSLSYLFLAFFFCINYFSNAVPKSILHHYKRSFGGFAVKLTKEEADRMAGLCRNYSILFKTWLRALYAWIYRSRAYLVKNYLRETIASLKSVSGNF